MNFIDSFVDNGIAFSLKMARPAVVTFIASIIIGPASMIVAPLKIAVVFGFLAVTALFILVLAGWGMYTQDLDTQEQENSPMVEVDNGDRTE